MGAQSSKGGGTVNPNTPLHLRGKKDLAGVGVVFKQNLNGLVEVTEIVGGSSADECGLIKLGDILMRVDDTKVAKASIAKVSSMVLGELGDHVKLEFSRVEKTKEKIAVTLRRSERATLEPTYQLQPDGNHLDTMQNPNAPSD